MVDFLFVCLERYNLKQIPKGISVMQKQHTTASSSCRNVFPFDLLDVLDLRSQDGDWLIPRDAIPNEPPLLDTARLTFGPASRFSHIHNTPSGPIDFLVQHSVGTIAMEHPQAV